MTDIVGHFLLFTVVAIGFLLAPLLLGKLLRPKAPSPEKDATYECGEPTIGSSYIQFDLRFYVVALLFIIFDVEVVFFFPWAAVYGNVMQLTDSMLSPDQRVQLSEQLLTLPAGTLPPEMAITRDAALTLAKVAVVDVLAFFGVLLVGFAYVWKRGDLDWVRAVAEQAKLSSAASSASAQGMRKTSPQTAS
ncbi:MAG: NADH-quinone oxidoreductase subunit A [Planctomycetales bacterium]|nr:NADH-quinone oxidoreductase subunit A [Planctomycetales bacterium]